MIFYLYYYLGLFILLICSSVFKRKIFLYLSLLAIIIISGTRYEIGYDYINYVYFFIDPMHPTLEPFFELSIQILNIITDNPQSLFIYCSTFTILIIYKAIKKYTSHVEISLLIYLLIPGLYLNTFSIVRQSLASPILFLGLYSLIYENKKFKYYILSLISVMFHYSAIIPIAFIFFFFKLLKKNYSLLNYIIILIFSIIISKMGIASMILGLAIGRYTAYIDMMHDVPLVKIVVSNVFVIILIFFRNQFVKTDSDTFLLNFLVVGVLIINVFSEFTPTTRLSYYFLIVQIILVPKFVFSFQSNSIRAISLTVFVVYYVLMLYNSLNFDFKQNFYPKITPYKNYYFRSD